MIQINWVSKLHCDSNEMEKAGKKEKWKSAFGNLKKRK
jgi:hypothetical protein